MKVVLSGYYGFHNVGDDAILLAIIGALKSYEPSIEIIVLSNDPENTKLVYGVDAINRWSFKDVYKALKESDGLISGGGSLLQDETGIKSIIYYTGVMKIAQFLRKPVFIYAQGMGPIHRSFGKKIVKKVLQKVKVTVRDEESKQLLQEIGLRNEVNIVPDPVLGLNVPDLTVPWWEKQKFADRVLTVSVREWPSEIAFKEKIAEALDRTAAEGIQIVFIPMHGIHDHETSEEVASFMKEKSWIAPYDATIQEKIVMIGKSDVFLVGMRLHALIFAALQHTPFIALSYDPKIDSFASISKQSVAGHVTEDHWTGQALYEKISSVIHHLDHEKEKLKTVIEPLQIKANETAGKAIQYFQKNVR